MDVTKAFWSGVSLEEERKGAVWPSRQSGRRRASLSGGSTGRSPPWCGEAALEAVGVGGAEGVVDDGDGGGAWTERRKEEGLEVADPSHQQPMRRPRRSLTVGGVARTRMEAVVSGLVMTATKMART